MINKWYSIIINCNRHDFFHSTRGLKQGDPLSPGQLILSTEVLSRIINYLYQNTMYRDYFMEPKGAQINYLSFADDVIIFSSTSLHSLKFTMNTLREYEPLSNKLIINDKFILWFRRILL